MDLHLMDAAPIGGRARRRRRAARAARDRLGGRRGRSATDLRVVRGGREAREQRHLLLPALHALQAGVGWISRGGLNYVSSAAVRAAGRGVRRRDLLRDVQRGGAARERRARLRRPRVPGAGGLALCEELERDAGPEGSRRRRLDLGPVALSRDVRAGAGRLRAASGTARGGARRRDASHRGRDRGARLHGRVRRRASARRRRRTRGAREGLRLLRRAGVVDPTSIDDYRAHGGYEALRAAHRDGPEARDRAR